MQQDELTVIIVEDDKDICQALVWVMQSVKLATEIYSDAASFLNAYHPQRKGCLILDIRMPGMSGLDLHEELIKRGNQMPIIFITGHGDVSMAVRAMRNGAFDFITKPFSTQHLIELVQRALAISIEKSVIGKNDEAFQKRFSTLSPREKTILDFIVDGKANKEIAYQLNLAVSTVELHRSKLMQKLGVKNLVELIKCYLMVS